MNENDYKVMCLHSKIEKNEILSKQLKALAITIFIFSVCYCIGTKNIGNIGKEHILAANLVWLASIVILIRIYLKDKNCIENNKNYEFDIYRLEIEALECKKKVAEIRGEVLPDNVLNKSIKKPSENVTLPIIYYGIVLGLDIVIGIISVGGLTTLLFYRV